MVFTITIPQDQAYHLTNRLSVVFPLSSVVPLCVGVAAVAIENSEGGKWIKENYKYSHCVPKNLQSQIDEQYLESFKNFQKITE